MSNNDVSHTHNRWTAFVRDNPGRPVPEETLTHSHPTWSSDIVYHLPPFTTIHGILFVHFMCLTILSHNLSPGPLWSSSWSLTLNFILHTFFHPIIIIFLQHMPYQRSLFCCKTNAMSSIPSLCLSSLLGSLSFSLMPHIHLTILISARWSATTFSFLTGQLSLPCNMLLCTQLLYNHHVFFPYRPALTSMQHAALHTTTIQPSSHNQRHILIGKQWYQLPELIPTNSNSSICMFMLVISRIYFV